MNKLVILDGEEWEALFVNGVLAHQDHVIAVEDIAAHCPIETLETRKMPAATDLWMTNSGSMFPDGITLDDALKLGLN